MRKIPTLFRRDPNDMRRVLPELTPGCEWVLAGEGVATRKYDGTCLMLDTDGVWWARREVKPGKGTPDGFVALETDETTGKTVGWEPVEQSSFAKLFAAMERPGFPGTYELVGPKVNGNPERLDRHRLILHAIAQPAPAAELRLVGLDAATALERLGPWLIDLAGYGWEGVVWHHPDGRMAKLKARDFR